MFMADVRRNIVRRRQLVRGWPFSPRTTLALFLLSCVVTYAAIIGWQIIIESDNEYLETGAALLTVLVIAGFSICLFRQYRAYRRGLRELRQAHPHPSGEVDDPDLMQLRLYLRHRYGNSLDVDAFLSNNGGLTSQIIDSHVQHYTYSSKGNGSLTLLNDVELGVTRENTTDTVPGNDSVPDSGDSHVTSSDCEENNTLATGTWVGCPTIPAECSVCLMNYIEGDVLSELPCHHIYHRVCVTEWLQLQNACPMCKQVVLVLPQFPHQPPDLSDNASVTSGADNSNSNAGMDMYRTSPTATTESTIAEESRVPDVAELPRPASSRSFPPVLLIPLGQRSADTPMVSTRSPPVGATNHTAPTGSKADNPV